MSTSRRLFLHVGCPKTGTTYLQDTLWASRSDLTAAGLHLPMRGQKDHFFVSLVVRGGADPEMDPPKAHNAIDRLLEDLAKVSAPHVLISHELFGPATARQAAHFRSLLDAFEIHIILTVRDLLRQIPAAWQQQIQQRGVVAYEEFLKAVVEDDAETAYFWDRQDAPAIAERWRGDLPSERVHIVTVPPAGADRSALLRRFCHVLGVDPESLDRVVSRHNESLGMAQAELLRRVNVALGDRLPHPRAGHGRTVKGYFARRILALQGGRRPELPAELFEWCHDTSVRMIEQLRIAGYDVAGDLDDLIPKPPSAEPVATDVPDAELVEVAAAALADMLDQRHRNVGPIERLEIRNGQLTRARREPT